MANGPIDFGGHKLAEINNLEPGIIEALRRYGFIDVEQVQGALGVPDVAVDRKFCPRLQPGSLRSRIRAGDARALDRRHR